MPKSDPRKGELIGVVQKTTLLGRIEKAGLIFAISRLSAEQLDRVYSIFEDARPAIEAEDIDAAYEVLRRHGFSQEAIDSGKSLLGVNAAPQNRDPLHGSTSGYRANGVG